MFETIHKTSKGGTMNRIWESVRKAGYWLRHTFAFRAPAAFVPGTSQKKLVEEANKTV